MRLKDYINEGSREEFVVWGIPKGKKKEEILFTKANSKKEADKIKKILTDKHGCTKVRVQVIDFSTKPDFVSAIK